MPLSTYSCPVHGELQILKHFVDFASLLRWCHARSGRPVSPSPGDHRPARRSRRRAFRRGRIRARQATAADPQSFPDTFTQSPPRGSHRRGRVWAPHTSGPLDSLRDRAETLNALEAPSSADNAEISPAVLAQETAEAGPEGTQPGSHRRRRRDETAESDLGLPTDRATDHPGLRDSHEQGCGATHSRRSVPAETRRGAVLAHGPRTREGQSVEPRSISMRIGPSCAHTGCSW